MKRMVLMCLTVVLGLTSVNSASAGFIAGSGTNVVKIKQGYKAGSGPTGTLVNVFNPVISATQGTLVTQAGTGTFPSANYSQALAPSVGPRFLGYNVYLVAAVNANFSVTFTDQERVVAVAASNGITGLTNNWASHISLQSEVLAALQGLYGNNSAVTNATNVTTGVWGTGTQAIEIVGSPDTYLASETFISGIVNNSTFEGIQGLNELSLVFTVVPEPTSLGLFGIGTLVVGLARMRRKKS